MKKFKISLKTSFTEESNLSSEKEESLPKRGPLSNIEVIDDNDRNDNNMGKQTKGTVLGLIGPPSKKKTKTIEKKVEKDHNAAKDLEDDKKQNTDFKIYVSDLAPDVTDKILEDSFKEFGTVTKATVVRDRKNQKSKGFGFVFYSDGSEYIRALKEANGRYVGGRPVRVKRSTRDW